MKRPNLLYSGIYYGKIQYALAADGLYHLP